MSVCAPARAKNEGTCFLKDELSSMIDAWNHSGLGTPIHVKDRNNKQEMWSALNEVFAPICDNEACWIENETLMEALEKIDPELHHSVRYYALKPKFTKGHKAWLSTTDIEYVMHQYMDLFPPNHFDFWGVFPSDHFKLNPHHFPIDIIRNSKYSAATFNLDSTDMSGSHWITCFFIHPRGFVETIEYFDSTGDPPTRNLREFLSHPEFRNADIKVSTFKHQRGDAECGVYSLFYTLQRLEGKTFEQINSKRISDTEMNQYRRELFNMIKSG